MLHLDQLDELPLVRRSRGEVLASYRQLHGRRLLAETMRRIRSHQVADLVDATRLALDAAAPADSTAVRQREPLVRFSPEMAEHNAQLKRFLRGNLYRHARVVETTSRARGVIGDLFAAYLGDPQLLPAEHRAGDKLHRAVADYIAGMTDRFALREHCRLTGRTVFDGA